MEVMIRVQQTPNPDALKFVVNKDVKFEGKATFVDPEKCYDAILAKDLLQIPDVCQVHLFENVITISKISTKDWSDLEPQIRSVIETRLPIHNPHFKGGVNEEERRKSLPFELQRIEEILDRTIRPGLQGDGGDLEVLRLEEKVIYIRYQGACGSCPSSTQGTMMAIEEILRREFDPEVTLVAE